MPTYTTFDYNSRQFIKLPMQGIAILTFQYQLAIVEQRYDYHCSGMLDVFAYCNFAVR